MSTFTKVGNMLHDSLLNGSTMSAAQHISTGAGLGTAIGVGNALYGGSGIIDGALGGATQGAVFGAGTRYVSMKYTQGVANFIRETMDTTAKTPLPGVNASTMANISKFKFSHFNRTNNGNYHANYWDPYSQVDKGKQMLNQVDFNLYEPRLTIPK